MKNSNGARAPRLSAARVRLLILVNVMHELSPVLGHERSARNMRVLVKFTKFSNY